MTAEVLEQPVRKETVKTEVEMLDGRKVVFAGKKKMIKEVLIDKETGSVALRLDFVNGESRTIAAPGELTLELLGHGLSQKVGDEAAGETDVDDMVIAIDAIAERLAAGKWSSRKEGEGGGFSGASIVIKAIAEVTGKSAAEVKTFLDGKLATAEAKGEKLTRQALYASFRNHGKIGHVIARMEAEKGSKGMKVDAHDMLKELEG